MRYLTRSSQEGVVFVRNIHGRGRTVMGVVASLLVVVFGTTSAFGATSSGTAANVAYAKQQVAAYERMPTFVSPGPAFDIAKAKGKSIIVIPASSNQYDNTIEAKMKSLATQYGVKYTEYPNQGQTSQWVSSMNEAIAAKPSLIILNTALDPNQVLPEVEQAKAAGIPVIATHFYDQTASIAFHSSCGGPFTLCNDGLTASVNAPFDLATKTEIDWIIANSNAHAHILLIAASDVSPSVGMVNAARAEVKARCSGCKLTIANLSVSVWTTQIPTVVETALARDSNLKYVLPEFDFGAPYAVTGITTAGKARKVKVVTYNGTQSVLKMVEDKQSVAVDVGEPLNWLAYAFMDQAFRVLSGVKPSANEHTPIRVFMSSNVAATGTPPTVTGGYGNAYIQGYEKLWKKG
jgi:ribose transport system substrate-binding protein